MRKISAAPGRCEKDAIDAAKGREGHSHGDEEGKLAVQSARKSLQLVFFSEFFCECQEIFSSYHSHCLRTEDLGHVECRVEGDVGGDVDDGHRDAGDHDGAGEIPHRILHLLDHKVEVVPPVVGKEA